MITVLLTLTLSSPRPPYPASPHLSINPYPSLALRHRVFLTSDEPPPLLPPPPQDPEAVQLNQSFMNRMAALEMAFVNRNRDPRNWTRVRGKPEALEYTLLYPSSRPGVTMRGVPYSASI